MSSSNMNIIAFYQESLKMDYLLSILQFKDAAVMYQKIKLHFENSRGYISRAGIIKHSVPLLRALLECGYYSREGLI